MKRQIRIAGMIAVVLLGAQLQPAVNAADFREANRVLRDGAIQSGNTHFDPKTRLVLGNQTSLARGNVCQGSLEYAAALFSAEQQMDRANAVVSAVLDYQDLDQGSPTFGNFRWWHDEARVRDHNAVCFMTPWLSHLAMKHGAKLTGDNQRRLREALQRCIRGVRAHRTGPDYSNIWLLKAASLVMLSRALEDPGLEADGAERIERWIGLTAKNGVTEYNSPCYSAVDIYALEWIHHYAASETLRRQVAKCLDYLYADVFQHWHWDAAIGAGTHSRAYETDRDTGHSLVSCLVFKQCGQPLRMPLTPFCYVFAVNDYPVPDSIRSAARKQDLLPLSLRTRILQAAETVECSLYVTTDFSLASQTGRRPVYDDRPFWDIPFKITYAGSMTERRASYIAPKPTTKHTTVASVQQGPLAIVLYEADLKDSKLQVGRLRLDIEPREGGMCDEILVAGRPYNRSQITMQAGTVIGWRVARTLVAVRLLQSRGLDRERAGKPGPVAYLLGPATDAGLCLDCPLTPESSEPVNHNDLNAGFVVACSTTDEHGSLAEFLRVFGDWAINEKTDDARHEIRWQAGGTQMRIEWDAANNRVLSRTINGREVEFNFRYDSPLIRLADGELPAIVP